MTRKLMGMALPATPQADMGRVGRAPEAAPADASGAACALMRPDAAAARLGIRPKTLETLRGRGAGPMYVLLTPRSVRYRPQDLDAFVESRLRTSTAAA